MKSIVIKFVNFSFVVLAILIYSCGSDPVTTPPVSTKITVNGKFQDQLGTPYTSKTVIIGSQTATTDNNGTFTINNVTVPYDIYFLATSSSVQVLKGLTITNPQMPATPGETLSQTMTVQIPVVPIGSRASVLFIDTSSNPNVNGVAFIDEGTNNNTVELGGPDGKVLNGIVYVLQYTRNAAGVITGYTKFGQQGVTITLGTNPTVNFTPLQLSTVPGTANVSGIVNAPAGYTGVSSYLKLNFGAKNNISHDGTTLQVISNSAFNFVVPTGLPSSAILNIVARSNTPIARKLLSVSPGTSNALINLDQASVLSTPPNGAVNIDTNSLFTYTQGGGTGINIVAMGSGAISFVIYTNENTVKIPNLAIYGYPIGQNVQYNWVVKRSNEFNSINDFCSTFYELNPIYKSLAISAGSQFTTKP